MKTRIPFIRLGGIAAAVSLFSAISPTLHAQQPSGMLEEIIVTSQKREQSLQDVSVSVNVVTGSKLDEAGLNRIEEMQDYVPNLTMSETGVGNNIYIRGIGSGINPGFEQSAAMFVDGVHYGRGQLYRAPMFDLERVEVMRGPQSILFGKNAIAGAIAQVTARPTEEFEGELSVLFEPDHGELESQLVLSGTIADDLMGRLSYRGRTMDGYMDNSFLNTEEPERDEQTLRLQLLWEPTADLSANLKYQRNEFDVVGRQVEIIDDTGNAVPGINPLGVPYSQLQVALGESPSVLDVSQDYRRTSNGDYSDNEADEFTLTVDYQLGDLTLTSITSSLSYEFEELCDCDFSGANVFEVPLDEQYDQFSQELRLTSPGGETIDWIAGAFYQSNEIDAIDRIIVPQNSMLFPVVATITGDPAAAAAFVGTGARRTFSQDTDSWALFGQGTWNITDRSRLTLGLRYTDESKDGTRVMNLVAEDGSPIITDPTDPAQINRAITAGAIYAGLFQAQVEIPGVTDSLPGAHVLAGSRSDDQLDYLIGFEFDLNEDLMLYATASSGFKSGGFDARSNVSPTASTYAYDGFLPVPPGTLPAGTLDDGAFEYEDETAQTFEIGTKMRLAGGAAELNVAAFMTSYDDLQVSIFDGTLGFNVGNAAEADITGLELDGRWQFSDSLGVYGSLAFLDFEFKDFLNGECYFGEDTSNPLDGPRGASNCDRSGATNQYVADYSGVLGLEHYMAIGQRLALNTALDMTFTDEFFTAQNNDPSTVQDAYAKLNMRIALSNQDGDWEVALLGRNLTDKTVVPYTNPVPLSGTFGGDSHYGFVERPRSVAVQGTYRF